MKRARNCSKLASLRHPQTSRLTSNSKRPTSLIFPRVALLRKRKAKMNRPLKKRLEEIRVKQAPILGMLTEKEARRERPKQNHSQVTKKQARPNTGPHKALAPIPKNAGRKTYRMDAVLCRSTVRGETTDQSSGSKGQQKRNMAIDEAAMNVAM